MPIMCQLFRMKSNCGAGKGPCEPQCCGFPLLPHHHHPPLGTWPSPPACCLPDPSNTTKSTPPLFHPTHIIPEKRIQPSSTSPLFHIPRGALVKSNPIIRLSAVPEKKELSPRFLSRLPFHFPRLLFDSKRRQDDPLGPFGQLLLSFFRLDLSLLFLLLPHSICFFFFFLWAVSTSVPGLTAPENTRGATWLWGTTWLCCAKPQTHTHWFLFYIYRPEFLNCNFDCSISLHE